MTSLFAALVLVLALTAPVQAEPTPFIPGSMAAIRAANAGRPHVVALWSVDCPPCHAELAMLGEWRRANPDARVVLISTDTAQSGASADAVLRKHGLGSMQSWMFADEFVERLRYEIDPAWRGELPRSYLNDGRGSLAVSGRLERARLDAWWRTVARP